MKCLTVQVSAYIHSKIDVIVGGPLMHQFTGKSYFSLNSRVLKGFWAPKHRILNQSKFILS